MALGDKTSTFTSDNAGSPEPVMVNSHQCQEVTIRENVNLGGATVTGGSFTVTFEWIETTSP